jgi:transcriptional regulator with XRE-family HTH domain
MQKIKQIREAHKPKMSLRKLAELTGLSRNYLNELENGTTYPKNDEMARIARALGVTEEELTGGR